MNVKLKMKSVDQREDRRSKSTAQRARRHLRLIRSGSTTDSHHIRGRGVGERKRASRIRRRVREEIPCYSILRMFKTVRDGRHFVTFPVGFREERVGSMKAGRKEKMVRSVAERENLSRLSTPSH